GHQVDVVEPAGRQALQWAPRPAGQDPAAQLRWRGVLLHVPDKFHLVAVRALEGERAPNSEIAFRPSLSDPRLVEGGRAAFLGFGRRRPPADDSQAGPVVFGELEAVVVRVLIAAQVDRALLASGLPHAEKLGEEPQTALEIRG